MLRGHYAGHFKLYIKKQINLEMQHNDIQMQVILERERERERERD
jgi:hypothetical protein